MRPFMHDHGIIYIIFMMAKLKEPRDNFRKVKNMGLNKIQVIKYIEQKNSTRDLL